jgi:fatty acid desaturase
VTEIRRVRVVHPRTDAARRPAARPARHETDERTDVDDIYIASLIRSQRRVAVLVCGAAAVVLGGVAVLGAVWPQASRIAVGGIPLPWLVLAVLIYPVLMVLAWYAVRQSERNEDAFATLTTRR